MTFTDVQMSDKYIIHTDGSCVSKTRKGGWGAIIRNMTIRRSKRLFGSEEDTTISRMELMAVIKAVAWAAKKKPGKIKVYSDSQYVVKGINQWSIAWERTGWRSATGSVKNKDLWVELLALKKANNLQFYWVRGHDGNKFNEIADELAGRGRALLD